MVLSARFTPKVITLGLALQLALWLGADTLDVFSLTPWGLHAAPIVRWTGGIIAYLIAFVLNLEVAAEYRSARWLRFAWLALAGNAAVSVGRMVIESRTLMHVWPGSVERGMPGLLQHFTIVPANVFLLVGVVAMCWAYHQVGLGFTVKRRDWLAVAGIALLLAGIFIFREGLTEARSPFAAGRVLQQVGLVLLACVAAISVILHRQAVEMGGGKLALALRLLTLYALLRGGLVLGQILLRLFFAEWAQVSRVDYYVFVLAWQVVPWVAALAAAHRAELTVNAAQKLQERRAARAGMALV